ncbi:MAG: DUF222 domain-containing protein [Actinomycetota bacterium]
MTTEHAEEAADAAARTSPAEADELADLAADMPADRFAKKAREWANARETRKAKKQRHRRQRQKRSVRFWTASDGMVQVHAELDAINGARVLAALRQRIDALWRADGGRDGTPDDQRSPEQRAADAFVDIMTSKPATSTGKPHPRDMVHLFHNLATGETELADGTPVPDEVLIELGSAAEVVGHVFSGDGRPLWLGRSTRLASRDQWFSLIARDRGCDECGAPVAHCEAHHPRHWEHHGRSDIDNLQLLCTRCHANEHRHQRPYHRRSARAA